MSWCTITADTPARIDRAHRIRRTHRSHWTWRGPRCTDCDHRWGRHGCPEHLWATDYLSSLSTIIITHKPPRPTGRHRPAYTRTLAKATRKATRALRPHPGLRTA